MEQRKGIVRGYTVLATPSAAMLTAIVAECEESLSVMGKLARYFFLLRLFSSNRFGSTA
jgi:hypothetical protein